jgi:hypothetical protein
MNNLSVNRESPNRESLPWVSIFLMFQNPEKVASQTRHRQPFPKLKGKVAEQGHNENWRSRKRD